MIITVEISDAEKACLENDLTDINDWVQSAVIGKIAGCRKRLIREWQPRLFSDVSVATIPADDIEFTASLITRADYRNRRQRIADETSLSLAKSAESVETQAVEAEAALADAIAVKSTDVPKLRAAAAKYRATADARALEAAAAKQAALDAT